MNEKTVGKVPVEILVEAVECFITIARKLNLKHNIISTDVIEAMCASFEVYFLFNFQKLYESLPRCKLQFVIS